jgi:hypothetical protein
MKMTILRTLTVAGMVLAAAAAHASPLAYFLNIWGW